MLRLVRPHEKYKKSFLGYMNELVKSGKVTKKHIHALQGDFGKFVIEQKSFEHSENIPKNDVPRTVYWIVSDDKVIGQGIVHHRLNKELQKFGGHIGYSIRPTERRKGYGTIVLRLLLRKAQSQGFKKVLLVVRETNIPSVKIIEHAGGKPLSKSKKDGVLYLRYQINL